MSKIQSNKIFVFPCVSRDDVNSKLMSEKNITNILKSITDEKSYVISWDDDILKCVIEGYYFEVEEKMEGNKYAHIYINNGLLKGDTETDFEGLVINDVETDNDLILCVNGVTPIHSYEKFKSSSLHIHAIDCGELN